MKYRFLKLGKPQVEMDINRILKMNRVPYKDELFSKSVLSEETERYRKDGIILPDLYLFDIKACSNYFHTERQNDHGSYRKYNYLSVSVYATEDGVTPFECYHKVRVDIPARLSSSFKGGAFERIDKVNYLNSARTRGSVTSEDIEFLSKAKIIDLVLRFGWNERSNCWSQHPKILAFILSDGTRYEPHGEKKKLGPTLNEDVRAEGIHSLTFEFKYVKEYEDGSIDIDWKAYDEAHRKYDDDYDLIDDVFDGNPEYYWNID